MLCSRPDLRLIKQDSVYRPSAEAGLRRGARRAGWVKPYVAARAGCAVVPVTIKNTGYLMPVGDEFYAGGRLRKGDVTMVVHAPLYADPSVKDPVADLQERAREAIASRL